MEKVVVVSKLTYKNEKQQMFFLTKLFLSISSLKMNHVESFFDNQANLQKLRKNFP